MSSRKKKKKQSRRAVKIVLLLIIIVVVSIIVLLVGSFKDDGSDKDEQKNVVQSTVTAETSKVEKKDIFPYELEEGKLEVTSLFQYSGSNPDCGDEEGENIASLSVTNKSDEQLVSAELTAVLLDGTEIIFEIKDVPAGKSVMVFSRDNISYEMSNACESISCTAEFSGESAIMEDQIAIQVDETTVTLTNLTEQNLTDLTVCCHCLLDEDYFGGLTYSYPVESIAAGESITLQAEECYLGEAAVVRIQQSAATGQGE